MPSVSTDPVASPPRSYVPAYAVDPRNSDQSSPFASFLDNASDTGNQSPPSPSPQTSAGTGQAAASANGSSAPTTSASSTSGSTQGSTAPSAGSSTAGASGSASDSAPSARPGQPRLLLIPIRHRPRPRRAQRIRKAPRTRPPDSRRRPRPHRQKATARRHPSPPQLPRRQVPLQRPPGRKRRPQAQILSAPISRQQQATRLPPTPPQAPAFVHPPAAMAAREVEERQALPPTELALRSKPPRRRPVLPRRSVSAVLALRPTIARARQRPAKTRSRSMASRTVILAHRPAMHPLPATRCRRPRMLSRLRRPARPKARMQPPPALPARLRQRGGQLILRQTVFMGRPGRRQLAG